MGLLDWNFSIMNRLQMKEKIAGHTNNSPFRNNLLNSSGLLVDNEKSTGSLMSSAKPSAYTGKIIINVF